jgi:hypothetical protein
VIQSGRDHQQRSLVARSWDCSGFGGGFAASAQKAGSIRIWSE